MSSGAARPTTGKPRSGSGSGRMTYRFATSRRMAMQVIEANSLSGYGGLRQVELPKPQPAKDRVLVRVTAAGVTPLDHTILSGGPPRARAPLVLGNEGGGGI